MPEDELLSKKELLELTGISYGQLYRWKRKNLIPEEWFIRKSTFTGQETFFPKREILARIERIKNMKDELSLDELADVLSPNLANIQLKIIEVSSRNIVTDLVLLPFIESHPDSVEISFAELLALYTADVALQSGNISLDEATIIIRTMEEHMDKFQGRPCELLFIRNRGVGVCLLIQAQAELYVGSTSKVVFRQEIAKCLERLKLILS